MKTNCKLCGAGVQDSWEAKWKHLCKKHPGEIFSRLLPMAFNPSGVRDRGFEIGRILRERLSRG
jgi:hypothetical protein